MMSAWLRTVVSTSRPTTRQLLGTAALAIWTLLAGGFLAGSTACAGEADLLIPDLTQARFFNESISGWYLLFYGSFVIAGTRGISLYLRGQIKALPAHESMLKVADIIFETCKTYLLKQAQFLALLFALWSSSRGMSGLITAFNIAYQQKETRNFFRLNLSKECTTLHVGPWEIRREPNCPDARYDDKGR